MPFKVYKDSLPVTDDLLVPVGGVEEGTQDSFVAFANDVRYDLIQIQIDKTDWLFSLLFAQRFQTDREQDTLKN
ncbi:MULTISPECIES: hypothetical protein [Burkholderia cepacia complex]|uniref:Uncharacterized protein n=1 Tax=Burkholderia vietnamiensis TaxID=60552 RepID=A0AAW7TBT5_BURVI|nr:MULTISPECIES: hypothetical protein [Burkholderia cepacia complex]MDN7799592.1 hypothetical protein [Burkholderia vietnamiensis]